MGQHIMNQSEQNYWCWESIMTNTQPWTHTSTHPHTNNQTTEGQQQEWEAISYHHILCFDNTNTEHLTFQSKIEYEWLLLLSSPAGVLLYFILPFLSSFSYFSLIHSRLTSNHFLLLPLLWFLVQVFHSNPSNSCIFPCLVYSWKCVGSPGLVQTDGTVWRLMHVMWNQSSQARVPPWATFIYFTSKMETTVLLFAKCWTSIIQFLGWCTGLLKQVLICDCDCDSSICISGHIQLWNACLGNYSELLGYNTDILHAK